MSAAVRCLVPCWWIDYEHRCSMAHCPNPAILRIDGPTSRRHLCAEHTRHYQAAVLAARPLPATPDRSL